MAHLQPAVEMSSFGNCKNSGISPATILPLPYFYISRMLRYQKKRRDCVFFFQPQSLFQTSFVFERYLLVLILTRADYIKNVI